MPFIGPIEIPEITTNGEFPFVTEFPHGRAQGPEIIVHQFGPEHANGKIEQRYVKGNGAKEFHVTLPVLTSVESAVLGSFWTSNQGAYGQFTYHAPNEDGSTTDYTCRFKDSKITFESLYGDISSCGVDLVEVVSTNPEYAADTMDRFPDDATELALAEQVQVVIPLVKITPLGGVDPIFLSDRRCIVNGDQYEARLLENPSIEQSMDGANDQVTLQFANADRVMTMLANAVDLYRARVEFSYFHVGSLKKIDLWAGDARPWKGKAADPTFTLVAADGFHELNLPYPRRKITRQCWKVPDNADNGCPMTAQGTLYTIRTITQSDQTQTSLTFAPVAGTCDLSWDGPNGCLAHGMENFFGGIIAHPQTVVTKDNSTGFVGLFRSSLTTASLVSDSIYGTAMPEIYCDFTAEADPTYGLPVACKLAAFRDEGDFKVGLGIIGEGPLTDFGVPDPVTGKCPHTLDGQPPHGWTNDRKNLYGLRLGFLTNDLGCNGEDPVPGSINDHNSFSLGEGGAGIQHYGPERAAGTAFAEIRTRDEKGLQVSALSSHSMQVSVRKGRSGFVWTDPSTRVEVGGITNPIWIAVNAVIRAKGVQFADAATQAALFDMDAAIASAAICDIVADKEIGTGQEKQFEYVGTIGADGSVKPLKDVLQEILNSCLGYYTFSGGKIRFGIRENSSAVEQYSDGNMIYGSLEYEPIEPAFNQLTATILDQEQGFAAIPVDCTDQTAAIRIGTGSLPQYEKTEMNLAGVTTKSRAARIGTTRVREEQGGFRAETYAYRRQGSFLTTLLGLSSDPGQIIRIDHVDLPSYPATLPDSVDPQPGLNNMVEARVQRWKLNPDFSVQMDFKTTHNEIYDLVVGPKPADVGPAPTLTEEEFAPDDWTVRATTQRDGILRLDHIAVGTNADTVHQAHLEIYYVDESTCRYGTIVTSEYSPAEINTTRDNFLIAGAPPDEGLFMLCDSEIMQAGSFTPTIPNFGTLQDVQRGQLGTKAAFHQTITTSILQVYTGEPCKLRVEAGLKLRPGSALVVVIDSLTFEQERIASYDASTGILFTRNPISIAAAGLTAYSDPRLWRLEVRRETINFQPRFFRSPYRSKWEYLIDMPHAGVALIRATLENTRGKKSRVLTVFPVAPDIMEPRIVNSYESDFPHRIRTLDATRFDFQATGVPAGTTTDAFRIIRVAEAQPFESVYAQSVGVTDALEFPPALSQLVPSDRAASGFIDLGGTVDDLAMVHVYVTGSNEVSAAVWLARDSAGVTTPTLAAASLADWLNGDSHFASYFSAEASGTQVKITDLIGRGGTLQCEVAGSITAAASGFTSALGILIGRKYATCRAGGGFRSELSPLSEAVGPTGDARRIELRDVPTGVELYATPDGADSPFYLIPQTVSGNGCVIDTTAESGLPALAQYPGATQPSVSGAITVTLKQDGSTWATLVIPDGQIRSNVVHGFALDPISEDTEIGADVDNGRTFEDLQFILQ
jgi:hypothetical protein